MYTILGCIAIFAISFVILYDVYKSPAKKDDIFLVNIGRIVMGALGIILSIYALVRHLIKIL